MAKPKEMPNLDKRCDSIERQFSAYMEKLDHRRRMLFNDAPPELISPLDHVKYQSQLLWQTLVDFKVRVAENHFIVRGEPNDDAPGAEKTIEKLEAVLNAGATIIEERLGYMLQDAMADCQFAEGYAVIGVRRCSQTYPKVPEFEYMDELPEGKEADRYEPDDSDEGKPTRRYKETPQSVLKRTATARAQAGFPYTIEVFDTSTIRYKEDSEGIAWLMHIREVAADEYESDLADRDKALLHSNEGFRVYGSSEVPKDGSGSPSANKVDTVRVMTLWNRDSWWEYVAPMGSDNKAWQLVDSENHAWNGVPFAVVPAVRVNHPDIVYRYQPYAEAAFRLKGDHDRTIAIMKGLAERIAIPDIYMAVTQSGAPGLDASGKPIMLDADAASTYALPEGWDFKIIKLDMSPAFVEAVKFDDEEWKAAMPSTGQTEVGVDSRPWALRIAQQMSNALPKHAMRQQVNGLVKLFRMMAKDMSTPASEGGMGATISVYSKGEDGVQQIVSIEPEEIRSVNISVDINPVSSVEEITALQHGVELLNDPLVKMTFQKFAEDYANWENPERQAMEYDAQQVFEKYLKPGLIAQKVAEQYGTRMVLGVNGEIVGMGGQPVPVDQALAQKGIVRAQPQIQPGAPGGVSTGVGGDAIPATTMPPMTDNPPQGVMPQTALGA